MFPDPQLVDAITRLRNNPDFTLFTDWLKAMREETRAHAEVPGAADRDFHCGGARILGDILQHVDPPERGRTVAPKRFAG